MIDILPHVASLLAPLGAQIEPEFRDTVVTFPLIVLSTPSNAGVVCGRTEVFTRIVVQVDVYTLDKHETQVFSGRVDDILRAGGFKRSNAFPMKDDELERMQMSYNVYVDYTHNRIMTM